ncbi:oligosaccharide flippase family protein [Salaquimonas pukyongi]|uniref:oligosaccharide flippase family protein n=1 Tax=Salaquimonas pukyongi TaxID=2712698 RepID=UPI00096B8275|nr:oligosaccharide flippase family protein [Salaquimonas pukyongi]
MTVPLRRTATDIALTFSRQFLAGLMQLGQVLIVARVLGPEGAGTYAVALLLPTLMTQLLNLGLNSANVYFVASRQFPLEQVWATSRNLMLLMSIAGLALGLIVVTTLGALAFPGVPQAVLVTALLIYPPSLMAGMAAGLFQALEEFRAFNIAVLVQPMLSLAGISLLWLLGGVDLVVVLLIVMLSHVVALTVVLALLHQHVPLARGSFAKLGYLRPALTYGMKAHLGNLLSFLNHRLDLFLVNLLAGPAAAGIYTVAVRFAEQLWIISQAVSTVILPRLSAMVEDEEARRAFTPFMARAVLWSTLVAAGLLATIAQPLINLLFGLDFAWAAIALAVLLPGIVLFACARVLGNDMASRGGSGPT